MSQRIDIEKSVDNMSPDELSALLEKLQQIEKIKEENPLALYEPNRTQKPFHESEHGIKWLYGGNMSGKTYAGSKETVCELLEEDPSGTTPDRDYKKNPMFSSLPKKLWFGTVNIQKAIAIYEQDLRPKLPRGSWQKFDNKTNTLYMKNDNILQLMSYESDIRMWQSDAVDGIWLDEQPPFLHFKEARSRVNRKSGRIWCTMTPLYANSAWAFREIFQNRRNDPNIKYWIMDLMDNIHLTPEQIQAQLDAFKGTDEEESRLHGRHMVLQGVIHSDFNEEVHVIEPFEITKAYKQNYEFCRVIDLHKRNPNVCQWFMYRRQPNPEVYLIKELSIRPELIDMFCENIKHISGDLKIRYTIIDSADSKLDDEQGKSLKSEMIRHGIAGIPANRSHGAGRARLDEYLRSRRYYIFSTCTDSINSIMYHIWDNYRGVRSEEVDPKETWVKKDDHQVRNMHYQILMMPALNTARAIALEDKYLIPKEDNYRHYFGGDQSRNYQKLTRFK